MPCFGIWHVWLTTPGLVAAFICSRMHEQTSELSEYVLNWWLCLFCCPSLVYPLLDTSASRWAPLTACFSAYPVQAVSDCSSMSAGQCSSVPCGLLQVYDWCCQSSAAPLCKSPSAHRATTPSHQVRSSGVFCCRPDGLELAARLSAWSII